LREDEKKTLRYYNDAAAEGERSLAKGAGAERLVMMKSANLKSCRVARIDGVGSRRVFRVRIKQVEREGSDSIQNIDEVVFDGFRSNPGRSPQQIIVWEAVKAWKLRVHSMPKYLNQDQMTRQQIFEVSLFSYY
jgi:hypothetical protein